VAGFFFAMETDLRRPRCGAMTEPGTFCCFRDQKMKSLFASWPVWALLSAAFAALTAIFAKIGVENVNSDFAIFIRTIVIFCAAGLMVYITGNWQQPSGISGRTWLFLVLSGLATGASWICYFSCTEAR